MSELICKDCGRIIDTATESYIETADGDIVCSDCMSDYRQCRDCGDYFPRDDMYIAYGEYVCATCMEENYTVCDRCDELICNDDIYYTRDGRNLCDHCLSWEDYRWCEECCEYVPYNEYNHRVDMCNDCAEANGYGLIKSYHAHKCDAPLFYVTSHKHIGVPKSNLWFFGVEWELESDYCDEDAKVLHEILGDRAYYEDDCSIDGFECIFQPHTYEALVNSEAIKKAFEYAKQNMSANDTGLHVHISRTAFGETEEEQEENIAKLVVLHQRGFAFEQLTALSRRNESQVDEWCRPLNHKRYASTKEEFHDSAKRFAVGCGDHGTALNCSNSATVEFRLGSGTTDYEEFIAWIEVIKLLVDTCKTISIDEADNFYMWFANASDELKEYMTKCGVEWEEPVTVTIEDCKEIMVRLMDAINSSCRASHCPELTYNQLMSVIGHANMQTRLALGFEQ